MANGNVSALLAVIFGAVLVTSACGSSESSSTTTGTAEASAAETTISTETTSSEAQPAGAVMADPGSDLVGLNLIGTSGDEIVINRLWIQGCIPGTNGIDWQHSSRVLITTSEPFELVTTLVDFQNGSATPDCETGRVGSSTFSQAVEFLDVQVPFSWVDAQGIESEAPAGLESATTGNGMEGIMTEASVTPESQNRADQLNDAAFCGVTTWAVNETQDTLLCFNGGTEPVLGTTLLVIDNRELPWKNYQAALNSTLDENGFPNQVPNIQPFEGPFEP